MLEAWKNIIWGREKGYEIAYFLLQFTHFYVRVSPRMLIGNPLFVVELISHESLMVVFG